MPPAIEGDTVRIGFENQESEDLAAAAWRNPRGESVDTKGCVTHGDFIKIDPLRPWLCFVTRTVILLKGWRRSKSRYWLHVLESLTAILRRGAVGERIRVWLSIARAAWIVPRHGSEAIQHGRRADHLGRLAITMRHRRHHEGD